jgi:hypothetical protein
MGIRINDLKKRTLEQHIIIMQQDNAIKELLKLKTYNYQFSVKLDVQDKSKITMYGRNNTGTQIVPSVKTYELKIDACSFIQLIDKSKLE